MSCKCFNRTWAALIFMQIIFRFVAFNRQILSYFRFFLNLGPAFLLSCTLTYTLKNTFKSLFLKRKQIKAKVSKNSARAKKTRRGRRQMPPPIPHLFWVKTVDKQKCYKTSRWACNLKPWIFELYRNREPMDRCEYDTYIGKYSGSGDN